MPEKALSAQHLQADGPGLKPAEAMGVAGFLKVLFRRTMADKVPVLAAALSFFTMLSIVPVLLLALAILGFVMYELGNDMQQAAQIAVSHMEKGIARVLPGANVEQTFRDLAEQIDLQSSLINLIEARGIALATGLLSLVWAAMQIFVNASGLMNLAFDVDETRSWIKLRLTALFVTVGAALLFLFSLLPTSGPDFVRNLNIPWLGLPDPTPFWVDALFALVALAINAAMFAFVYKFLPNTRVAWKEALVGGASMAILWEIAKKGFTLFLAGSDNPIYGAMGGVILLITWMYYTNILLLLGAEVSGLYRRVRVGAVAPTTEEAHRQALEAVHAGQAVPLSSAPAAEADLPEAKQSARETVDRIKGDIQEVGATLKSTVHDVKATPARHSAGRAFQREPDAEERRLPAQPARSLAGARGGGTPNRKAHKSAAEAEERAAESERRAEGAEQREQERRAIEERAAREFREDDYPPVDASKQRAKETVDEIKAHVQSISRSVKRTKDEASTEPGP